MYYLRQLKDWHIQQVTSDVGLLNIQIDARTHLTGFMIFVALFGFNLLI